MTYHKAEIPQGEYGEASKIVEEFHEFMDALDQGASIMALVELSDLVGAIQGYLKRHHPSIGIQDLITMGNITQRAFELGTRHAKTTHPLG